MGDKPFNDEETQDVPYNPKDMEKTQEIRLDKKPKGPIRFEAIIPVAIIFALAYAYFHFFFDSHLKFLTEYTGTQIHGAEVNVASIRTSFISGSFEMNSLQVTDKNKPERNLFEIGSIRFDLNWDALLRAKAVVDEAAIENIQALSPRKSPGRVLPPEPESSGNNNALRKLESQATNKAKEEFGENFFGNIINILQGSSAEDQLKDIQGNLKTEARIKELDSFLKNKETEWNDRLKALPQAKEFEAISAEAKKLKFQGNPIDVAKDIQKADLLIKEADAKIKAWQKAKSDIDGDVNGFQASVKELDTFVQNDMKDLQDKFKIPDFNAGNFAKGLFMDMVGQKIGGYQKYIAVARKYMPPKKDPSEKETELIPPPRSEGKNFQFPITTGYPTFWLKTAKISSELGQSELSGDIKGELKNLTSNPIQLGIPMTLDVSGDFPKQQVMGFKTKLVVDHTTESPKETIDLVVNSYPGPELMLVQSSDVKFGWAKSQGQMQVTGTSANNTLQLLLVNNFRQPEYIVEAKNKIVQELLSGASKELPIVTIEAKAKGTWDGLDIGIDSNLGTEIGRSLQRQVQAKIDEARAKLKAYVDGRVGAEKARLQKQFDQIKGQINGELSKKQKEIDAAKKQAEGQIKGQQKGAAKPEQQLKKMLGF